MKPYGGFFDYATKREQLNALSEKLQHPAIWKDQQALKSLHSERAALGKPVRQLETIARLLEETEAFFLLLEEEDDAALSAELDEKLQQLTQQVAALEFARMFNREEDPNNAFLDIQAGSGGTEAQDWSEMLLRMYLRWAEAHDLDVEILEKQEGEVAGIKSVTLKCSGDYAYGWLRTETGVHRLVRKSPFDSGNRRHTSFAAVFVSPEIDDSIAVEINPADLRVDTYRSSGAGGQHVNTTDSAIRITHLPTNIVVQCQNQRSQHQNRDQAMRQLRAKLYEREMQERRATQNALEASKSDIGWGSQIRSYVLDDGRVKDLRTGVETGNWEAVLNGDIDRFIETSLKQGV